MIKKLTYDTDKCLIDCDGIVIPSHNVKVLYNSNTAMPFVYFDPNSNGDNSGAGVAIVGPYGSTHRDLVNQNMMLIRGKYQIKNEQELLRGRIWENVNDFGDMITIWDTYYGGPISSDLIKRIKESLCIHEEIEIGDMWLSFLCDRNTCDYYLITVDDYIFGGYSDKKDLIAAFEKQGKISHGAPDKYKEWDIYDQGIGYLGYHLMTRQDESKCKKLILSESDIKDMVVECVNRILTEHSNMKTLYHFTTILNLSDIAKTDKLESSNEFTKYWDNNCHISLTRHKSNYEGFAKACYSNVRITLNIEKINSRHNIVNVKPMEYYSPKRYRFDALGKEIGNISSKSSYQSNDHYENMINGNNNTEFQNQAEEGLQVSNHTNLEKLHNFVERIDIYWPDFERACNNPEEYIYYPLNDLQSISETKFGRTVPIFVYFDKKNFSLQNKYCIKLIDMVEYFNKNICNIRDEVRKIKNM